MQPKPRLLLLWGMILLWMNLSAQSAQLNGHVFESQDQSLAYANVLLHAHPDSSLVKAEVTDENGTFQMAGLPAGDYWLEISFVGLPTLKEDVSLRPEEHKQLASLIMPEAGGTDLAQVTVAARRPLLELKNDKMIFNVENSINAIGNNGLELLRKAPGVLIDNNNNITMLGRAGVRIFINGKPSPLRGNQLTSYLESLQSTSIDAIEIITNPGSRYEAEGNAGIINIRMKKDAGLGANGNFTAGYQVGKRPAYHAGLSTNFRNKWMNAYGSYSINKGYYIGRLLIDRRQHNFTLDQRNSDHGSSQPQNFRFGTDFYLSEKSTLGVLVEGGLNAFDSNVRARTILGTQGENVPDSLLLAQQNGIGSSANISYNLNYLWQINKEAALSIDANYGNFTFERTEFQPNYYTDITETNILSQNINETVAPNDIDIKALKVDYDAPLGKGTFGAGLKLSQVNTKNNFRFYNIQDDERVVDENRTNEFFYKEHVNAAYFNYSRKLDKVLNFQLGLRVEETRSDGQLEALKPVNDDRVRRSYFNWFPSASLNITASDNHQLQLSYSRRINRPSYQSLNPFTWQLDELTFHRGNPFLQPEYSNIYQIRHSFKFKLNTTLSYSHTTEMMALQAQAGEGKIGFRTWINLPEQHNYSINVAAPTSITDSWSSFVSLTAYYRQNKGDFGEGKVIDLQAKAVNLYTQQTVKLGKGLSFELSGFYNSPTIHQANSRVKSQWSTDLGLKIEVLQGNGNLTLALSDVFKTQRWTGEIDFGGANITLDSTWDSRRLKVNFSYLFGNQKVKKARNRKTGLDEEKRRTK